MKVNIFMPKYMEDFVCIGPECKDTCCAGWDINIDESTYNKYENSKGQLRELVKDKYIINKGKEDSFNYGMMLIKNGNKCPFLNNNMLCDIHSNCGEVNLSITCKRYPRVFNIVDDIYEKSGLASCEEICIKAFLNKEKMEFVEAEEELDEDALEIRRIIDTDAFEGTESLLQYFWDIRVISISIMQCRAFTIEERFNILRNFYEKIQELNYKGKFSELEEILEEYSNEDIDYEIQKGNPFKEDNEFYRIISDNLLFEKIRGRRLKLCIEEYRENVDKRGYILDSLEEYHEYSENLQDYSYILENYIVNQMFKNLVPFDKGENLLNSINELMNRYKIIKAYIIGISMNSKGRITEKEVIRVIQAVSKDMEHNVVFNNILDLK